MAGPRHACVHREQWLRAQYISSPIYSLIPLGERMLLRCSAIAQLWQCTGARERDLRCMQLILYPSADYFCYFCTPTSALGESVGV